MRILGLVDIHSKLDQLEDIVFEIEEVDLVLIAGDITNFGETEKAREVLEPLLQVGKPIYAVTGNCDYSEVDRFLEARDIHLEGAPREISGVGIIGVGGSLMCPTRTPHEHSEDEFASLLEEQYQKLSSKEAFISVVHQPPANTKIDSSLLAGHVGSHAVRRFIEEKKPLLSFSGHIHESAAIDMLGATQLVNPGPFLKGYYWVGEVSPENVEVTLHRL